MLYLFEISQCLKTTDHNSHGRSYNGPFSRHFGIFHGPKHVTTGSNRAKNTCLIEHPKWSRVTSAAKPTTSLYPVRKAGRKGPPPTPTKNNSCL